MSDTKNVANYQDNHNMASELAKVEGKRFGLNRIKGNGVPKYAIDKDEHELNYTKVGRLISVSSFTRNDYLRISGFEFCSILNNARFNPWVHICTFLEI